MNLDEIVEKNGSTPDRLIQTLLDVQKTKERNDLTQEDLREVARAMGLPESRVYSVATFYSLLSTRPRGKYVIQICRDVPCGVSGSMDLKEELENLLRIGVGETTGDGLFSLEYASCLGYCEQAPVMRVGQKIYGNLTKDKLARIIAGLRRL